MKPNSATHINVLPLITAYLLMACALHSPSVLAACTPGAQCAAHGASTAHTIANSTFQATGTHTNNAALRASNGGRITGSALTINATGSIQYGVHVNQGGTIVLTDGSTINARTGVELWGDNSVFRMTGGSLNTINGAVSLVGKGNNVVLDGVSINNTAGFGIGMSSSDSTTTLSLIGGTTLKSTGGDALVAAAGTTRIEDSTILLASTQLGASALNVHDGAGGVPIVRAKRFAIETQGKRVFGVFASYDSDIDLQNGSITTQGLGAYGIHASSDEARAALVTTRQMNIKTVGAEAYGIGNLGGKIQLHDSHISTSGDGAHGIFAHSGNTNNHAIVQVRGGSITTTGAGSYGALATGGAEILLDNTHLSTNSFGVFAWGNANIQINKQSMITTTGTNTAGLGLLGGNQASNIVTVDASHVNAVAQDAWAIYTFGSNHALNIRNGSTVMGDRLVFAGNCPANICGVIAPSRLNVNADASQLFGHANVASESRLSLHLKNGTVWTLRPSIGGTTRSDVTFLQLDASSRIVLDPASPARQTLVVGSGHTGGNTAVYQALAGARIDMNTWLDAGGALTQQNTDRLIVNGDALGTTLLAVQPIAGSPGAATGYTARDGISLVQVYGDTTPTAFALEGGYVAAGPWQYHLYAFDPAASDPDQRVMGSGPFWDFRLQTARTPDGTPQLVPQAPSYLAAPVSLFQAGLLDIATLHRRTGHTFTGAAENGSRERGFFLRGYGGDYHYRAKHAPHHHDTDLRYTAIQGGGHVWGSDTARQRLRAGLSASVGQLAFEPRGVRASRKTQMTLWSVAPTFTWESAAGAYTDAVIAYGGFRGNVSTQARGQTIQLQGKRLAASVEAGIEANVGDFHLQPQIQVTYQQLRFDRRRDVDGIDIELGRPQQWTLRAGSEVRRPFALSSGSSVQVYGKLHLAHSFGGKQHATLADAGFTLAQLGTVLEAGVGVDAQLAGDKAVLYADLTREQRLRRTGHQGWAGNLGVKVLL